MSKKIPVIIDCDPGHDDALALMWALSAPDKLDVRGVTTVAGNQTLEKVTRNALKMLTVCGRTDIPLAVGAAGPVCRPNREVGAPIVHGESGLDGPQLPEPACEPVKMSALELLIKLLSESEEELTLVVLGAHTNVACLFTARPDLKEKIERIYMMGGGTMGNWTPAAEFNIWFDPESARTVFNSGVPITMAGLDATQKAYVTREENELLRAQGGKASVLAAELIDYFSRYHYKIEGFPGCTLHDPSAIAALLVPEVFGSENCRVDVETSGELTSGMTVIDRINYIGKIMGREVNCNAEVLFTVDREAFVREFLAAMKRLDALV
ncbi:MAG: nucleoside hydrolase [Oscillospiraceae bacterium]|nr:nucleoside hydrolase [Oscillospiraceae bacterium]